MKTSVPLPDPVKARAYFEDKMTFTTGPVELDRWLRNHENINVIDVRAEEDYRKGHIPGAVNLSREHWSIHEGLSKDRTNVLYCYSQVCHLAATAACEFSAQGYPVMELEGGFETWKEYDMDVEKDRLGRMFSIGH